MSDGRFQPVQFQDFSGGINTKEENNVIADNQAVDIQNMVFDGKGAIQPRFGSVAFGSSTSAVGSIRNTWNIVNINNQEVPIRNFSSLLEYFNYQTNTWENLDGGYTVSSDFGRVNYDYKTYFSNKTDYQRRWNGIIWSTSTYADSAYSRIDISTSAASAVGFLSAGSVVIGGEEVYYSSYNGTALSGITFTKAHDGGVGVAQLPTSSGEVPADDGGWVSASDHLPHGSVMTEKDAQIFVTGLSANLSAWNGNVLWYSAVDEPTNYTISATPGGGGSVRYPEAGGSITGAIPFDTILAVYKENTIRTLEFIEVSDGSAGSLEIVNRSEILTGPKMGSINQKAMSQVGNDIFFVTPAGWIDSVTKTRDGRKTGEISRNIRPTVEGLNMTSSTSVWFDGKYYLACGTSGSSLNNIVYVYDTDYQGWTRFNNWNVGDWYIRNNILYFGASNEIATYRALSGFADDGCQYSCFWKSKWFDFGVPEERKQIRGVYVEGWCLETANFTIKAFADDNDESPIMTKEIVGTGNYVNKNVTQTTMGQNTWGLGTYGGGSGSGSAYKLYKFRFDKSFSGKKFFNIQFQIESSGTANFYKIQKIVPYITLLDSRKDKPRSNKV